MIREEFYESLARVGYETYAKFMKLVGVPDWDHLPDRTKVAWQSAVDTVLEEYRHDQDPRD